MPPIPRMGARRLSLADVLRAGLTSARKKFGFSAQQWKVFNSIVACRTGRLGAHVYQCEGCRRRHLVPHSCRDRHCPRCQQQGPTPRRPKTISGFCNRYRWIRKDMPRKASLALQLIQVRAGHRPQIFAASPKKIGYAGTPPPDRPANLVELNHK